MVDCLGKCILVCESAITTREASAADQMIPSVRPAIILAPREMRRQAGHVSSRWLGRRLHVTKASARREEGSTSSDLCVANARRAGHVENACAGSPAFLVIIATCSLLHFSAGRCLLLGKQLRRCLTALPVCAVFIC